MPDPYLPEGEDEYSLRQLEDGDPHYVAIGMVAYSWTRLEMILDGFIDQLLLADSEACQCVTAQFIGPGPRWRAIAALAGFRGANQALLNEINKFGRLCTELSGKRNRIVHDIVFVSTTTGKTYKALSTADKKLEYGYASTTDAKMKNVAKEIDDLTEKGRQLYFRMTFEIGTTAQKEQLRQHGILPTDNSPD